MGFVPGKEVVTMKNAWSAFRGQGKLAISVVAALLMLAVGGLSVALAAGGGSDERSNRDRFVPGPMHGIALAPDPGIEADMEEFHECMSAEGFDPPEPAERPEISERPPKGLDQAFETCGDLLPRGMPPGPPIMGPGPAGAIECRSWPGGEDHERHSDRSGSAEESSGE